ncbi:MAG: energy transducer TonB [Bacteroidia bacterium]|nr:energy transducer TonB [Bacteroidia bacterium]
MKSTRNLRTRIGRMACLSLLIGAVCCCTNQKKTAGQETQAETAVQTAEEPVPFTVLDEKPLFNGLEPNNFVGWVNLQIKLPESMRENPAEGKVLVSFVVDTLGKVTDVKVLESSLNMELDSAVVRAVSLSPDWTPGVKDGQKTACTIKFPVIFQNRK